MSTDSMTESEARVAAIALRRLRLRKAADRMDALAETLRLSEALERALGNSDFDHILERDRKEEFCPMNDENRAGVREFLTENRDRARDAATELSKALVNRPEAMEQWIAEFHDHDGSPTGYFGTPGESQARLRPLDAFGFADAESVPILINRARWLTKPVRREEAVKRALTKTSALADAAERALGLLNTDAPLDHVSKAFLGEAF